MDAKAIRELADATFTKKLPLNNLHQEIAENFYPQRADFTVQRHLGDDFASGTMTSFPALCARELGGAIPSMLRPTAKQWFEMLVAYTNQLDYDSKAWLQWATQTQRRAMYDPASLFNRAMAQADMDWAVFGMAAIQCITNEARTALLHRTWHLRDMAWLEDEEGNVCPIFRKWKAQARVLKRKFKNIHRDIEKAAAKEPFREFNCYHFIVDPELYDGDARGRPYWSIYFDADHNSLLEAVPIWNKQYAIPRWQTVSGSQWAYSPAVVIALPEARLLQSMTYTLLEAGEKATNPPMVATEGAVRSDVQIFAGGTTWVDYEYDERLGDALRPLSQDLSGLPIGMEMQRDCRAILRELFYLSKIKPFVPTQDPQMTAFQAGQIVAQYIRDALPIFEPMEAEYNAQVCELDFDNLLRNGAFGSMFDMPRMLQEAVYTKAIKFRFQSPLHDAIEAQKGHKFLETKQLILEAVALDKNAPAILDVNTSLRDALEGIGTPTKWTNSEVRVRQLTQQAAEQQNTQALLANMEQAGKAGKLAAEAAATMAEVEQVTP